MILIALFLGTLAVVLAFRERSWSAPAPFFTGYWALAITLPSLAGYPGTSGAAITIGVLVLAWATGGILASAQPPSRDTALIRVVAAPQIWRRKGLAALMVGGGLTGAVAAYTTVRSAGFNLSSVLSLGGLFQVGNSTSVERYSGPPHHASSLMSLLLMVTFMGSLAAPRWLLSGTRGRFSAAKATAPICGAIIYGAVSTARTAMVVSCALWAGSYLTCRSHLGSPVRLRAATVSRITICAIAGILVFGGIAYIRIGGPSAHGSQKIAGKVESYAFGYLPAFSAWQNSLETPSPNFTSRDERWGDLTFNGLTKFIIKNPVDNAPYPEFVTVDNQDNKTNIYTSFRGLIEDFGMLGAAIFMLIVGFIAARSYEIMRSYHTVSSFLATTAIASLMMFSIISSLLFFTNVCAAFLMDAIVMHYLIVTTTSTTSTSGRKVRVAEGQRV